jgi:hypothetical protein
MHHSSAGAETTVSKPPKLQSPLKHRQTLRACQSQNVAHDPIRGIAIAQSAIVRVLRKLCCLVQNIRFTTPVYPMPALALASIVTGSHRKSAHKSHRPSPGLTSPTTSNVLAFPRQNQVLAPKRSWVPLRMKGAAPSDGSPVAHVIIRANSCHALRIATQRPMGLDIDDCVRSGQAPPQREDRGNDGHAQGNAVVTAGALLATRLPGIQNEYRMFCEMRKREHRGRPTRMAEAAS